MASGRTGVLKKVLGTIVIVIALITALILKVLFFWPEVDWGVDADADVQIVPCVPAYEATLTLTNRELALNVRKHIKSVLIASGQDIAIDRRSRTQEEICRHSSPSKERANKLYHQIDTDNEASLLASAAESYCVALQEKGKGNDAEMRNFLEKSALSSLLVQDVEFADVALSRLLKTPASQICVEKISACPGFFSVIGHRLLMANMHSEADEALLLAVRGNDVLVLRYIGLLERMAGRYAQSAKAHLRVAQLYEEDGRLAEAAFFYSSYSDFLNTRLQGQKSQRGSLTCHIKTIRSALLKADSLYSQALEDAGWVSWWKIRLFRSLMRSTAST
jgi:hypothetical protein